VACTGQKREAHKIWRGNTDRYHLEDLRIDGRTLKWILNRIGLDWLNLAQDRTK
jgi:hypothetical protein